MRLSAKKITHEKHQIDAQLIDKRAAKVVRKLKDNGYQAYLVGGCVRDLLLNKQPKDFDVATNATPEEVKSVFSNCRLIGKRFRLAHILFGRDIIEVATFRGHHDIDADKPLDRKISKLGVSGQILRDNVYGSIEEDAARRDFTINAMYFDVDDDSVLDFAGGLDDLRQRCIRFIGDDDARIQEDPVRMLRAVRFSEKLNLDIEGDLQQSIRSNAQLLKNIPPARLFEEVLKLLTNGAGVATYKRLVNYGLFQCLFPQLQEIVSLAESKEYQLLVKVLENTDNRINTGQNVSSFFIYGAFLWYPVEQRARELMQVANIGRHDALQLAADEVLKKQSQSIMIPKRYAIPIRELWFLQPRLEKRIGRRPLQTLQHPRFRAAYDFLLIRSEVEPFALIDDAQWWTNFQQCSNTEQQAMLAKLPADRGKRRRRPKRLTS